MIPVSPKPEPAGFDAQVRQPGHRWLRNKGWALEDPPRNAGELPAYWRKTNQVLWRAYDGICAYLCIYFAWPLGAASTDHFVAKSSAAGLAYEWSNYRLSCLGANRRKNRFDDLLDPFHLEPNTFELNPVNGEIRPAARLAEDDPIRALAVSTISRLGLNSAETKDMRTDWVTEHLMGHIDANYLRRRSPFVWQELARLNLLRHP